MLNNRFNNPTIRNYWDRCKKHKIECDITTRWENGTPHHPKAKEIFKLLKDSDFVFGEDYFCWKSGGDGDNGETLMYSLSIYLELMDAEK
jgi:hypothetical protein